MKTRLPIVSIIVILITGLAGCNPSADANPAADILPSDTLSAQTPADPTAKTVSTAEDTPAPPQPSPTVSPTEYPLPCNRVAFSEDVTIPVGWQTSPGVAFTKTWRLRNEGACPLTSDYQLVFDHGDRMGASDSQQLTSTAVPTGETVDLSVILTSPAALGEYQAFFYIRAPDGSVFGTGSLGKTALSVKIQVVTPTATPPSAYMRRVVSEKTSISPNGEGSVSAACPEGMMVTGGGFSSSNSGLKVYRQEKKVNGWIVYGVNNSAQTADLAVQAICLSLPSAKTTQSAGRATIKARKAGGASAVCPLGSVMTGGGYQTDKDALYLNLLESAPSGNVWQVSVENYSGKHDIVITVYVICLSGASVTTTTISGFAYIFPQSSESVEIACPGDGILTGGGWAVDDFYLQVKEARVDDSSWLVRAWNSDPFGGSLALTLQARAVCLTPQ
jgi:hypothetical protein